MKKYPDLSIMVIDSGGLFAESAIRLADDFGKVYYYCPWILGGFVRSTFALIGSGYEDVTKVLYWEPYLNKVDYWYFPDLNLGPMQVMLRDMGKKVFGSMMAEEMEIYRDELKKFMSKLGLPVGKWDMVVSLDALREYIKNQTKTVYAKTNLFRGDWESLTCKKYKLIEDILDRRALDLGHKKYTQEFIVEHDLPDKVEIGYDGYVIDGVYPKRSLAGIEEKGRGYLGSMIDYDKLPKELTEFTNAVAPALKNYGARTSISTENRVGKDHISYMIDLCMRTPSPPGDLYFEFYTNFPTIIKEGADGNCVDPDGIAKYGMQVNVFSEGCEYVEQALEFPAKYRRNIKMRNGYQDKNEYIILPIKGNTRLCAIVTWGDSVKECEKQAEEIYDSIETTEKDADLTVGGKLEEKFKELAKMGIKLI